MELILLRHGAAPGNLLRQYLGTADQPLAPEGERLAEQLRSTAPRPDILFSSPLLRCRQTARLVWPGIPVLLVDGLKETDLGAFEGKTWEELRDIPAYRAWIDGRGECPNGEPRAAAAARIQRACDFCLETARGRAAERCGIVTHGGVVMQLLQAHCGGALYDWQPPLCGGWQVRIDRAGNWGNPTPFGGGQ